MFITVALPSPRQEIIDYNDYIYNISQNSQVLHSILDKNSNLQSSTSSIAIVLADIIYQNSQLFSDLGVELLRKVVKLSVPLIVGIALYGATLLVETTEILSIIA